MKKIVFVFSLIMFSVNAMAQDLVPTKQQLKAFFDTKTYVVLDPNPISHYNFKLKEAIKANWDVTDYEFVKYDEFEGKKKNPDYSFLMENIIVFEKDKTKARYRFLSLKKGDKVHRMEEMPTICAVPLSYREVDEEYYSYKLGVIIRFIQKHVRNMRENPEIIDEDIFEYYNQNIEGIKDKTLYLIKDEMAPEVNTRSEIEEYYSYDFKLVTRKEVEQAIKEQREDVIFLHKVGPQGSRHRARCYKILMGAKNAKFYYFDYHFIKKGRKPDGFLKKDFKKLDRKASGGFLGL
jgi:hypothetical protein